MKKFGSILLAIVLAIFVVASGCQSLNEPLQKASPLPMNLPPEWTRVSAGNTDWYFSSEGTFDSQSGWTTFNRGGNKILAKWESNPNPSGFGESYYLPAPTIQLVDKDGFVLENGKCFDVQAYNRDLESGINEPERIYDPRHWNYDEQASSKITVLCHFNDGMTLLYGVLSHQVYNASVTVTP